MIKYTLRPTERVWFPRPDGMSEALHALLIQRGIRCEEESRRFLNPTVDQLHDPMLLHDMDLAVARIRKAVNLGEKICVYGDYDVDGVSASTILSDYLRTHGAPDTEVYLPSRHTEGYGLNENAVREIASRCKLLITVDCGITAVDMVDLAKSLGMDCVVTDHHEPTEQLPDCPTVDPLLGDYPFGYICGAGVAFKLVHALGGLSCAMLYVDIAALATVADVVPLKDENRVLVSIGLARINRHPRVGIRALIETSDCANRALTATDLAFRLAPRLNASGRLGTAQRAYALLSTDDPERASALAAELEAENNARKTIENRIQKEAEDMLSSFDFLRHRAIVLCGEDWNPGVIGLTASRLVEKYHYPTILLAEREPGVLTGSCRSIPGVDIHAALAAVEKHLVRYGGHKQAAGLTVMREELPGMIEDLDRYLSGIPANVYIPIQEYDTEIAFDALTETFVRSLEKIQPTGFGNPAPVFRAKSAYLAQVQRMGAGGAHLSMQLSDSGTRLRGVLFGAGELAQTLPSCVDVLFSPDVNVFKGKTSVELKLKAIASGDAIQEISAKKESECELQREFLTEILYNKKISLSKAPKEIDVPALKEMLAQSLQGTLILAGDLDIMASLAEALWDVLPDRHFRTQPADPRLFHSMIAYPHAQITGGWTRVVFAGVPAEIEIPQGAEAFALRMRPKWADELPDLDGLRTGFRALKYVLDRRVACADFESYVHVVSRTANVSYANACACLIVMRELSLIRESASGERYCLYLDGKKKCDPETSEAWRRIQSWRA